MQIEGIIGTKHFEESALQRFPLQPMGQQGMSQRMKLSLLMLVGITLSFIVFSLTRIEGLEIQAVIATTTLIGILLWNVWWFRQRQGKFRSQVCFRVAYDAAFLMEKGKVIHQSELRELEVRQVNPTTLQLTGDNWPTIILTKNKLSGRKVASNAISYRVSPGKWQRLLSQLLPQ